jgi:hypothetical protein
LPAEWRRRESGPARPGRRRRPRQSARMPHLPYVGGKASSIVRVQSPAPRTAPPRRSSALLKKHGLGAGRPRRGGAAGPAPGRGGSFTAAAGRHRRSRAAMRGDMREVRWEQVLAAVGKQPTPVSSCPVDPSQPVRPRRPLSGSATPPPPRLGAEPPSQCTRSLPSLPPQEAGRGGVPAIGRGASQDRRPGLCCPADPCRCWRGPGCPLGLLQPCGFSARRMGLLLAGGWWLLLPGWLGLHSAGASTAHAQHEAIGLLLLLLLLLWLLSPCSPNDLDARASPRGRRAFLSTGMEALR